MSKRQQDTQGGGDRYGFSNGPGDMADKPQQANAAQMARRKIAQVKKSGASARSSRANTPTGNPFAPQQQSMGFQLPQQGGGGGDGGGFNFSMNAASNPFQNANGASGTPPPSFGQNQQPQQQNGGGGIFGNNNNSFGSTFGSNASTPQPNGFGFGQNNNNANGGNTGSGFSFGQNNTQSQTQQNGTTQGSSNPFSFSSTNGAGNTQFQFGGQTQQKTPTTQNTSFSSFGQTQQTNGEKAATPFTGFGQSTQQQNIEKPATPSFNFGQTAQQVNEKPATPSFSFGQSNTTQPQTNGEKPSMFGAQTQTEQTPKPSGASLFTFNSSNQGIGNKSTPEPGAKPAEAPKAPMSNLFGSAQQNTDTGLFGSTPPPRESSATPKPGDSIFSTQSKPKLGGNLFTSDMAEGKKPEAPAPMFGQPAQQKASPAPEVEQTPKANNIFNGFSQPQANAARETPKPSGNLFSASTFGQTPAQTAAAPKNLFGQSEQDTSMNTPGTTPQKSLFAPATSQAAPAEQPTASETPAPGRSLFDRVSRPDPTQQAEKPTSEETGVPPRSVSPEKSAAPSAAQKSLFAPSTSLFNAPSQPATSNIFGTQSAQSAAPKAPSLSSQASASQSTAQPAQTSSLQKKASSILAEAIPDGEKETLKVLNEGLMAHLATQNPNADWTTIMEYYLKQAASIRGKPAPELKALSAAPSTTSIGSAQIGGQAAASAPLSAAEQQAPLKKPTPFVRPQPNESTSNNTFGSAAAATPKAPTPFQRTSSSGSQQTPKPSFLQPPSTAPVNRKRSAEEEVERPPATEKRARPAESTAYPKLPDNASDVSKVFFNALENKSTGASLFTPKMPAAASSNQQSTLESDKDTMPEGHKGPLPGTAQLKPFQSGGFTPSGSGFAPPSGSGFTPSTSGFKPSSSGFTPSMPSGGSNNFLAAFGKRASEQQDKDRKKRKAEDYDSDEETEEQWAERDRKEQEAKRAKVLEDSKKASGFVFKATSTSSQDAESGGDKNKSAESGAGNSLFDRISRPASSGSESPSLLAAPTPAKTPTSNIFGSSSGASQSGVGSSLFGHLAKSTSNDTSKAADSTEKGETVEKQTQGTGDNTWKQNTPIKFGASTSAENGSTTPAAPPPAFGNLFGPKTQSSNNTGLLNVPSAKPAMGFAFGAQPSSVNGSRATTPGVTTDGEGTGTSNAGDADGEPSDNPPADEPQVEDMTGLNADEMKGEMLLHTVAIGKASKWDEKKDDAGGMTHGWVDKGKGPIYLLKNDETGKVRILLKVPPYGAAKMNFPPLKGGGYDVQGKAGKQIIGTFYDHLAEKPGLGKWLVTVGKKEDAEEVSRHLKENMPE